MGKMKKWILLRRKELVLGAIFFAVSSLSFAAGYAADEQFHATPITIEECAAIHSQAAT